MSDPTVNEERIRNNERHRRIGRPMMNDRIADILNRHHMDPDNYGDRCLCGWRYQEGKGLWSQHVAAVLVAELWPRIDTVEQLAALPIGSVIRDNGLCGRPWVWERTPEGWFTTGYELPGAPSFNLSATLLHRGGDT